MYDLIQSRQRGRERERLHQRARKVYESTLCRTLVRCGTNYFVLLAAMYGIWLRRVGGRDPGLMNLFGIDRRCIDGIWAVGLRRAEGGLGIKMDGRRGTVSCFFNQATLSTISQYIDHTRQQHSLFQLIRDQSSNEKHKSQPKSLRSSTTTLPFTDLFPEPIEQSIKLTHRHRHL